MPGLTNAHLQTLWPFLFRRVPRVPFTVEHWVLPDGEHLAVRLSERPGWRPAVLAVHGLESSADAPYVRGLLARVHAAGWNGAAFDFRSCGDRPVPTRVAYHAGKTDDLGAVVDGLRRRWPDAPLAVVGFSLGGNVLAKWLGEMGDRAPVAAAVAVSAPFDLAAVRGRRRWPGILERLLPPALRAQPAAQGAGHGPPGAGPAGSAGGLGRAHLRRVRRPGDGAAVRVCRRHGLLAEGLGRALGAGHPPADPDHLGRGRSAGARRLHPSPDDRRQPGADACG